MRKDRKQPKAAADLRRRAEEQIKEQGAASPGGGNQDPRRLIHELEVHRVELQMQNEELRQARAELEAMLTRYTDLYDFAPVGYFTLERDGTILQANLAGARLLGVARSQLAGRRFGFFVSSETLPAFNALLVRVFASPAQQACELVLPGNEDRPIHVHVEATATQDGRACRAAAVDITQRKQAEQELASARMAAEQARDAAEQARDAAEQASRAKDHFLAVLSHELRTPLTPVLATASMLLAEPDLDPEIGEGLAVIRRNAELETRLIDDLLDMNRIARGRVELHKQSVALGEIVRGAMDVCRPDIQARGLQVSAALEPIESFMVEADAARLQQVFWNLFKNAVKFTPQGGRVDVRCRVQNGKLGEPGAGTHATSGSEPLPPGSEPLPSGSEHFPAGSEHSRRHAGHPAPGPACSATGAQAPCGGVSDWAVIEVSDTGCGIEPEALERIFNAFEQADRSLSRLYGGLGLGLTISRALVERHGGTIEACSDGLGRGATFCVRLPGAVSLSPEESRPAPKPQTQPWLPPESGPLRVLLVEDHSDTAKIMARLLTRRGCSVTVAGNVAAALELVRANREGFDLLISDLGLPDRSGLDLIRELRAAGQTLPAIALSGYGLEEDINRSRQAGFAAHLVKPINVEELRKTVSKVMTP